jgi:two-component system, sensor histidine kinase PdtaS
MSKLADLPTSLKIFALMTAALLPLGLIALLASLQASRSADSARRADLRVALAEATRKLGTELGADIAVARGATEAMAVPEDARVACFRIDMTLAARATTRPRYALFGPDRAIACASNGFSPPPPPMQIIDAKPRLSFRGDGIGVEIVDPNGKGAISLSYSAAALGEVIRPIGLAGTPSVLLADQGHELALLRGSQGYLAATDSFAAPVGLLGLSLAMTAERIPFTAVELLQAFLPLLMWASAAIVAFLVTDRLLIRPLLRLNAALAGLQPGARPVIPDLPTPAREIRGLAQTFDNAFDTIAAHEDRIAQALADQVKLTREVHHRVKNNLQVIASLISLHARGAPAGLVADAYASIQRRVDALAIVHRNHFAELEENHGVSAKALIGELASNLRTGLAASGGAPPVSTSVAPVHVSQDVAVPIAFLVTELVELSISEARGAAIIITLDAPDRTHAILRIGSSALTAIAERPEGATPRYSRIIDGLARQLRANLEYNDKTKAYCIAIPIVVGD